MQNEKNLTPEEVRSVITSRERKLTPAQIKSLLTTQLQSMGFTPDTAPDDVYYKACASIVRRILKEKRRHFMADCKAKGRKQTYYLCMEFLLGRSLKNSIYNLNLSSEFSQALKEMGVKMENLFELEPDAGLGNGGLEQIAGGDVERDELHIGELGSGLNDGAAEGIAGHDDDVEAFVNGLFDHGDTVGGVIAGGPEVAELDAVVLGKRLAGLIGGLVEGLVGDVAVVGDHCDLIGALVLSRLLGLVRCIGLGIVGLLITAGYQGQRHDQCQSQSKKLLHWNLPLSCFLLLTSAPALKRTVPCSPEGSQPMYGFGSRVQAL